MIGFSRKDTDYHITFIDIPAQNPDKSSQFPDLLKQNAYLTLAQDELIGYTSMDSRPRSLRNDEGRDLIYRYFPRATLSDLDIVDELKAIREELILQNYATETDHFSTNTFLERSDAKVIPGVESMVKRITRVGTKIIESCFDERERQRFNHRAVARASLCVGDEGNKYTSTVNVRLIDPSTSPNLTRVLEDDQALYTIRINLGIVQDGQFPGRICLPSFQEYCNTEPFTALVFKRTVPHFEIQQSTTKNTRPGEETRGGATGRGLIIEISPNSRLMSSSNELGYARSMPRPLTVFGTFQNYSEWLFRLAIVESLSRESRGNFVPVDMDIEYIAKLYGYQVGFDIFLPRSSLAEIILRYPGHYLEEWEAFTNRMKELHHKTCDVSDNLENVASQTIVSQPITWMAPSSPPLDHSRPPNSNVISSTLMQSTSSKSAPALTSNQVTSTNGNRNPTTLSNQAKGANHVSRANFSNELFRKVAVNLSRNRADGNGYEGESALMMNGISSGGSSNYQPPPPLSVTRHGNDTSFDSHQNAANGTKYSTVGTSKISNDNPPNQGPESADDTIRPAPPPLPSHPYEGLSFEIPEWEPLNGLTGVLNKQILNLFDIESLRAAIRVVYRNPIQPMASGNDLEEQLNIHVQALEESRSTLNDYFHLVSRSVIFSIIQQAPNLKKDVYARIVKSDERQRLRFGLSTKAMEADIFWKDFSDRNALVCQICLHVGTTILLAPGFYALILTAGGNSPGSNSLVYSPLQPAVRSRIVEACLWHSRNHPAYMEELKSFWEASFARFDPDPNEPEILKLSQNISVMIPSIGPCFPKHFTVLKEIINHTVNSLRSANKNEDIIWGRPYETDRLGCIREAGDCFKFLSKANLDRRDCEPSEAGIVFKNILSIRTLFFGNLKKLQRWEKFTRLEQVEELVTTSSPFEEWYGESRVYTQFQFPLTFQEFSIRLKSCWSVDWPQPLTSNIPDWPQVYEAASNADFAGGMMRSLVASDMSRFGWCNGPTPGDWHLLLNPSTSWFALNQLFPNSEKKYGPGRRFVDPSLGEVVTASLMASLEPDVLDFIGFDRIFVEHLLSRFSIFIMDGWVYDEGKPLKIISGPQSRKRKQI
ncbi:hypothetical protein BTUL_0190g00020 [Botrytis tulipae]|uniref:Uncharacterized protein n=1 Tax=Botrytis tulipae TaxID=87230 RepID=A0A4Z1EC99_9HELO|nr:hypothetical protein BTUL_0190g00020 [Botrytis tulipae]